MDINDTRLRGMVIWAYDSNGTLDADMLLVILRHENVRWTRNSLNILLEEMEDLIWNSKAA